MFTNLLYGEKIEEVKECDTQKMKLKVYIM